MLIKIENLSTEDALKIVRLLRRETIEDMVKLSIPDNIAQDFLKNK